MILNDKMFVGIAVCLLLLAGCGGNACDKPGPYQRSKSGPPLVVPADLKTPDPDAGFAIPSVGSTAQAGPCSALPPVIARAATAAAPVTATGVEASGPSPAEAMIPEDDPETIAVVRETLERWADAWTQGDFDAYLSFYSYEFDPPGDLNFEEWKQSRRRRLAEGAQVEILEKTLTIDLTGEDAAVASFVQQFKAGSLQTQVLKSVSLERDNEGWRIRSERVVDVL